MALENKTFELTIIFKNEEYHKLLDHIINSHFIVIRKEIDGWKRLAYPINGQDMGYYVFYDLLERKRNDEHGRTVFTNYLDLDDDILRYLLVNVRR